MGGLSKGKDDDLGRRAGAGPRPRPQPAQPSVARIRPTLRVAAHAPPRRPREMEPARTTGSVTCRREKQGSKRFIVGCKNRYKKREESGWVANAGLVMAGLFV